MKLNRVKMDHVCPIKTIRDDSLSRKEKEAKSAQKVAPRWSTTLHVMPNLRKKKIL